MCQMTFSLRCPRAIKQWIRHPRSLLAPALLACVLLCSVASLQAQDRNELETKRKQLLQEIEQTKKRIQATRKDKEATLGQFQALQSQVKKRQALIRNLEKEIVLTEESLVQKQQLIALLNTEAARLQEEYAQAMRTAYRMRLNQSLTAFLFAADGLGDFFKRWQYLRQYERSRKKQANQIIDNRKELEAEIIQLEAERTEKEALLAAANNQRQLLSRELSDKNTLLGTLKSDEAKLLAAQQQQQASHRQLNEAIENIIRQEIARRKDTARGPGGLKSPDGDATAVVDKLSIDFMNNRGKLPWPVKSGTVTRQFGNQPHPSLPGVTISNNGIDIRTASGAEVYAVFEGEVSGTFFVPGYKNTVMVQHGLFYTVYSNIEELMVRKGATIATGQVIGKMSAEGSDVHFEVWREKQRQNPVDWIRRR